MPLTELVEDTRQEQTTLKITSVYYTVEEDGYTTKTPIVHVMGRDEDGKRCRVPVEGFRPYFYVTAEEYYDEQASIQADSRILDVEYTSRDDLKGEYDLVKLVCDEPRSVGKLREEFEKTFEADVAFPKRFLIDTGIEQYATVPSQFDGPIDVGEITPTDPDDPIDPRVCVVDIEVYTDGEGVPNVEHARKPITAISAYDSYSSAYVTWVVTNDEWSVGVEDIRDEIDPNVDCELTFVPDERTLLELFVEWVRAKQPDILTGWNCVPKGTGVTMADGSTVPIEEVEVGDVVVGEEDGKISTGEVENTWETGVKDILSIQTQFGKELRCSEDHRILVGDDTGIEYREAEGISEGDYVAVPKSHPSVDTEEKHGAELMYKAGLIASDGTIGDDGVRFYNTDKNLHDAFGGENTLVADGKGSYSKRVFAEYSRDDAIDLLTDMGVPSGNKTVNEWDLSPLMSLTDEEIGAFIAGMVDGDGTIGTTITTNSENQSCLYWLRRLMLRIGIWATREKNGVNVGKGSISRFKKMVLPHMQSEHKVEAINELENNLSSAEGTVPSYIVTEGKDTSGDGDFREVNDKMRRGINVKRYEAKEVGSDLADEWDDFVFFKVTDVEIGGKERCYDIETEMSSFIADEFVVHNCSQFDYPYVVNRCLKEVEVWSVKELSPTRDIYTMREEPFVNSSMKGVHVFDMLQAYKTTRVHEMRSYSLEYVAREELGFGKEDIESTDHAYDHEPVKFIEYSIRDVEAVVEIEDAAVEDGGILEFFSGMQAVSGALYADCYYPKNLIDTLFLHEARREGIVLPSKTMPEESWYFGGKVFDAEAGKHENVLYPDQASLYPYLMLTLNTSPDTIVGTEEGLEESEYTKDDCHWGYIDTRPVKYLDEDEDIGDFTDGTYKAVREEKEDGYVTKWVGEPQYERCYFIKPSVKEGFTYSVVSSLVDHKYEYKGTSMYDPVKVVTNAVSGVFGWASVYTAFRLFDWRIIESVTLGGRKVITESAEQFVESIRENGHEAEVIYGDTDSVVTSVPSASTRDEAVRLGFDAAERVNDHYDEFMLREFGTDGEWVDPKNPETCSDDGHWMELEVEAYSPTFFIPTNIEVNDPTVGTKKTYANWKTWDESGGEVDEVDYTGFACERSDIADVTEEVQEQVLEWILREDNGTAKEKIYPYVRETVAAARSGDMPLEKLGIRGGIRKDLSAYGSSERRPQPIYRGARYADEHIPNESLGHGTKPMLFYVDRIAGTEYPSTYSSHTAEDGDVVDAIAVEDPSNVPDAIEIDYETHAEKCIVKRLRAILATMGWSTDDALYQHEQDNLTAYM